MQRRRQRSWSARSLAALVALHAAAGLAVAQSLYEMPEGASTRWASGENPRGERGSAAQKNGGRKGSPTVRVGAGESVVLAEASGTSGTVRRIWMTFPDRSPRMLRSLRIDMYWDGASKPAVSAPVGDFFGVGLGRTAAFTSALIANPEGRSFNCFVPMPFRTAMRIVMTNESDTPVDDLFYDVDYTLGDRHGANALYFHAYFNRENPTRLQRDYELLPRVEGRGRFLGVNVGVRVDTETYFNTWWGEGEVKFYVDGDREYPTLSGTGTEDYIGTAWGQGQFAHPYQGCPVADEKAMRWCFYRYHVPDPVYFGRDLRVTMQQIGYLAAHSRPAIVAAGRPLYRAGPGLVELDVSKDGKFERSDDWSSCAYFYLDRPASDLAPLMPVARRVADLEP
jgi:hypothetical protein